MRSDVLKIKIHVIGRKRRLGFAHVSVHGFEIILCLVECADRDLDPLTTNLVVADPSRTEKTICLAVSPSLKAYGISGACQTL